MKLLALLAVPLSLVFVAQAGGDSNVPSKQEPQPVANQDSNGVPLTKPQMLEMRADILMARKDYGEAAIAYQKLAETNPKNAVLLNKIGVAYQQLGQDRLAEHFYKKAAQADSKFSPAVNNLGTVEYAKQHFGKAVRYYKKAVAVGGDDLAPIYSNLGYAYCGMKLYPEATHSFSEALALDPNVFEQSGGAGGTLIQHRSTADPGTLHFLLAKSYAKLGDIDRTVRYLKLARDDGYKYLLLAEKDPDFAKVIKDPRVQDVIRNRPPYEAHLDKTARN